MAAVSGHSYPIPGIDTYHVWDILGAMDSPSDLLAFVRAGLKAAGPKAWPGIAEATGKPVSTLRKIAYGDRRNPRLDTIQPIANHLQSLQ